MKKECLENLTLKGPIEGKRNKGNHRITYLTSLCKCLIEQGMRDIVRRQTLLRDMKYRKSWRAVILHRLKGHWVDKRKKKTYTVD